MVTETSKRLFTADEYQRMARAGILHEGDHVELIRGEVVTMSPIGPPHNAAILRATQALVRIVGLQNKAYRNVRELKRGESIAPSLLPECLIPIDVLLP